LANDKRQLIIEVVTQLQQSLDQLKKLESEGSHVASSLGSAFRFNQVFEAPERIQRLIRPIVDFAKDVAQSALEAAAVQDELNDSVGQGAELISQYADEQMRRLNIDDEVIKNLAITINSFRSLAPEQLRQATQLALQYGGLKNNIDGAGQAIGKFLQTGVLRGIDTGLSKTASTSEMLTAALDATEGGLEKLEAQARTTVGTAAGLKTAWGEVKEELGKAIGSNVAAKEAMADLERVLYKMIDDGTLDNIAEGLGSVVSGIANLAAAINGPDGNNIHEFFEAINDIPYNMKGLSAAFNSFFDALKQGYNIADATAYFNQAMRMATLLGETEQAQQRAKNQEQEKENEKQ